MVIILAVTVGGLVWGIIGAALAVPLVAVLTGIVTYLVDPDSPDSPDSEGLETDDAGDSATDADPEAAGDATAGEAAAPAA